MQGRATAENLNSFRLTARPAVIEGCLRPGIHKLGIAPDEDALLYVPPTFQYRQPGALAVSFHGAGGSAEQGINLLKKQADEAGFVILAPSSRSFSWDVIVHEFGPDVELLDKALHMVFDRCFIDPQSVVICGFSDGASYALSLGLANGDLFQVVIAFTPGFVVPLQPEGRPRLFISHGTRDTVLPIDRCSRHIVPRLRHAGYELEYVEFTGAHTVPERIKAAAVTWWYRNQEQGSPKVTRGLPEHPGPQSK
jgi:phospholipase/carboxylesterase